MFGRRTILATLFLTVLGLAAPAGAQDAQRRRLNAEVFDTVTRTVERQYWDESRLGADWRARVRDLRPQALAASDETALYAVMDRLLVPFDDEHVNVQGPSVFEALARAQAPRFWAGFQTRQRGLRHEVLAVTPGGPAARAGFRPGQWLDRLDGAPFSIPAMLAAREGQALDFSLSRPDGSTFEAAVILAPPRPPAPPRVSRAVAEGVQVLEWDNFDEGVSAWIDAELAALPPGTGVVLDLRGNSGGSLHELRTILGCFVPPGTPLFVVVARGGVAETLTALSGCRPFEGPVVALIDRFSLSAAELLPASLAELGRAVVVGERSGGSVLLSRQADLPDGGRVSVSRADLRTVAGTRLEGVGAVPSVPAVTTFDDLAAGRDPALDAAVAVARGD
jgi:carboxyl-terminal processing protease